MDAETVGYSRLLDDVWPAGVPEREQLIWHGLLPDAREIVLARLDAVWRAERGEPWAPLAQKIGLGRSAFFRLRSLWRERSLEGIVPYARQAPRRLDVIEDAPVRVVAREMLLSSGIRHRNNELAKGVLERIPRDAIAATTVQGRLQAAERIVRHERRALATNGAWLLRNWGRRVVVDMSAVSIAIEGEAQLAIAAVCIDAASGLVMGSRLGRLATAIETERSAVDEAWRFVRRHGADRNPADWPPCDLDIMLPNAEATGMDLDELKAVASSVELRSPSAYRFGTDLVQLIGPRMGRIPLAPRSTLSVGVAGFSKSRKVETLEAATADAFWQREVLRHNEPVLRAIEKADVFAAACGDGRMAAAFYAIDGLLGSLPSP